VKRISEELQLKNVICLYNRIEEAEGKFDFIVSRALAEVKQVLKWTKGKCKAAEGNGYIFLKGGDVREELTHSGKRNFKVVSLRQYFSESYFETKKLIWLPFLPE
jgi:16S rRNA (guanine527-N7)-methyltransferase